MAIWTTSDLATFSLIVNLSILLELNHLEGRDIDPVWSSEHTNVAGALLVIVGVFLAAEIGNLGDAVNRLWLTGGLALASFAIMLAFNARLRRA